GSEISGVISTGIVRKQAIERTVSRRTYSRIDGSQWGRSLGREIEKARRPAAHKRRERFYSARPCASTLRARPVGRSKLLRAILWTAQSARPEGPRPRMGRATRRRRLWANELTR